MLRGTRVSAAPRFRAAMGAATRAKKSAKRTAANGSTANAATVSTSRRRRARQFATKERTDSAMRAPTGEVQSAAPPPCISITVRAMFRSKGSAAAAVSPKPSVVRTNRTANLSGLANPGRIQVARTAAPRIAAAVAIRRQGSASARTGRKRASAVPAALERTSSATGTSATAIEGWRFVQRIATAGKKRSARLRPSSKRRMAHIAQARSTAPKTSGRGTAR